MQYACHMANGHLHQLQKLTTDATVALPASRPYNFMDASIQDHTIACQQQCNIVLFTVTHHAVHYT